MEYYFMKQKVAAERKGKVKRTLIGLLDLDTMPWVQTECWLVGSYDWKSLLEKW